MNKAISPPGTQTAAHRPVLRKNEILALLGGVAALTALFFILRPALPESWSTPGSPELFMIGVLGAVLCLTPFAFSLAKRAGKVGSPPAWFIAHVVVATIGVALLVVHSGLHLGRPPALLLAGALFLVFQGAWARAYLAHDVSGVFGGKYAATPEPRGLGFNIPKNLINAAPKE